MASPRKRPVALHAATVTRAFRRMRFALYESASVSTSKFPLSATNHTGVETGVPSRRNVVRLTYFPVKAVGTVQAYGGQRVRLSGRLLTRGRGTSDAPLDIARTSISR